MPTDRKSCLMGLPVELDQPSNRVSNASIALRRRIQV